MISYNQISSKEDRAFHRIARRVLGNDYGAACSEANEKFIIGYNSGTETTCENLGRRAANLVILRWLREYGIVNWQDIDAPQQKRQVVKSNFVSQKVKDRKFNSDCQLWSRKL